MHQLWRSEDPLGTVGGSLKIGHGHQPEPALGAFAILFAPKNKARGVFLFFLITS